MPVIQEDSYWWRDTSLPEEQQTMKGLCGECHEERGVGSYWPGKKLGYGNYDLKCFICGKQIYLRDPEEKINDNQRPN